MDFSDRTDDERRIIRDAMLQYAQSTLGRDQAIAEQLAELAKESDEHDDPEREPVPADEMAQAQRTDWSFLGASWEGALTQEQAS